MNGKALIIARNRSEAVKYATDFLGLNPGEFTIVANSAQIRAARRGEIYLAPGWESSPQRHSIRGALRFAKVEVIEGSYDELDSPDPELDENGLTAEERAVLDSVEDQAPEQGENSEENDESTGEAVEGEGTEEAAEQSQDRRRRRRCKECNVLVDPDEVEEHAAAHARGE